MNRTKTSTVLLLCVSMLLAAGSAQASSQRMINRNWVMHQDGIQTFIETWAAGKSDVDFKVPLTMLLKSETNLMAYGVSIKDKRLVGYLMVDNGKPVSMRVFASRLFFKTLADKSSWKPEMTSTLKNKTYRVSAHSTDNASADNQVTVHLQ